MTFRWAIGVLTIATVALVAGVLGVTAGAATYMVSG